MYRAIFRSIRNIWRKEERLWKVFWLWWVLLETASVVIGLFMPYALSSIDWGFAFIIPVLIYLVLGLLGAILVFIYPFFLVLALCLCRKNVSYFTSGIVGILSIPLFLFCHIVISRFVIMGIALYLSQFMILLDTL